MTRSSARRSSSFTAIDSLSDDTVAPTSVYAIPNDHPRTEIVATCCTDAQPFPVHPESNLAPERRAPSPYMYIEGLTDCSIDHSSTEASRSSTDPDSIHLVSAAARSTNVGFASTYHERPDIAVARQWTSPTPVSNKSTATSVHRPLQPTPDDLEWPRIYAPSPHVPWPSQLFHYGRPSGDDDDEESLDALFLTYPPVEDEAFWARFDTPEILLPVTTELALRHQRYAGVQTGTLWPEHEMQ
ncbi:hypothetical protein C8Q76DRAFT_799656 [Earliella scabrosa]|nr:hypothetical protein C8Q76DRAFT_799656 [Earliella scabrosa]